MLQAQVNYWTLMENRRHNLEMENLQNKELDIKGRVADYDLYGKQEAARHNVATESLDLQKNTETGRHNRAQERAQGISLQNELTELGYKSRELDLKEGELGVKAFQAVTDAGYKMSLGDAALMNAETNANQFDLDQWVTMFGSYSDRAGARISEQNADTNRMNAESTMKDTESKIRQRSVENVTKVIDTISKSGGSAIGALVKAFMAE